MLRNTSYWTTQKTHEGANAYAHSGDHCVEFFSKAGSLFTSGRKAFYQGESSILSLFQPAFESEQETAMRLMFWLRDCRGGAGNRSGFRTILSDMAIKHPRFIEMNIHLIPVVGRWDDLRCLFNTPLEIQAATLWAEALRGGNALAAKWADRNDRPVRLALGMKIGDFRRFLANIRKNHIVEYNMCSKEWDKINYEHVPSVAMSRYTNAFKKNDEFRFAEYKESLVKGEKKVNASVLFPHDCVRTVRNGDNEIADAQFEALPNYMEDSGELIMVISDTSGSMGAIVGGSISAMDVSMGMALYCSGKMPTESPLYKRFIAFCSEGKLKDWRGMSFSKAVRDRRIFDGAVGGTRIDKALDTILDIALRKRIPQELMPTMLLIVSDMQFHQGSDSGETEVQSSLRKWDANGYNRPKIVYWNTSAYAGSQDLSHVNGVGMVSGFSPSILKSIFQADDFSPRSIMMKALQKYEVVMP